MQESLPILSVEPQPDGQPSADLAYSAEAPVCPMSLPTTGAEVLVLRTREAVVAALSGRRFSLAGVDQDQFVTTGSAFRSDRDLLRLDAPEITDIRRPIRHCFSEMGLAVWKPMLEQSAHTLASALAREPMPADLRAGYTEPFLADAVTSTLGLPLSEWPYVLGISDRTLDPNPSMQEGDSIRAAWRELYEYCDVLIGSKRARPDGSIFSNVVQALDAADKSADEILHACATILIGFPTPLPVLNTAATELLKRPELIDACLKNPALWGPTVDELLRYKAHFAAILPRVALEDIRLEDAHIAAGQVVVPSVTAAAHDPARVARPNEVDVSQAAPRRIVFGAGPHLCPGAVLSNQWVTAALKGLFTTIPGLRLAVPEHELQWRGVGLAMPDTIPVTLLPNA